MKYVDVKLGHQHKDRNQGAAFRIYGNQNAGKLMTLVGALSVIMKSSRTIV